MELTFQMKQQALLCLLLQLAFELSSGTNLCVVPGSSLELPCFSFQIDFPGAAITWKFNGNEINANTSNGSPRVKQGGRHLFISPVTAANEGDYSCLIKEYDREMIITYKVRVDASFNYSIKVIKGSTAHLPCHFQPAREVKANALWFKETGLGNELLNPEGDNRVDLLYTMDHDQTIIIRDVGMEDAGTYLCRSAEGAKLSSVNVIVEVAPTPPPHSCSGFTTPWEPCQDENSRTGEPMLQESITEFSMKLYSYLRESQPSSNLLFSPISIIGALSHLLLGARGDTRKAIERAVCVPHDFHCVHLQMKKLRGKLAGSLQMASQIYYNPEINLNQSFIDQSIQFYDAKPIMLLDTSEINTEMINSWVANKTNNKIQHLVDSVSPSTQLMLLNAVSFTGQWKVKYEMKPRKGLFTKLDGDLVNVQLLYHPKYMAAMMYVVQLKAQVVRLALTGGSSLYILLPNSRKVSDLQLVEESLTDTAPDMNMLIKKLGLSSLFESSNLCGLYSEERVVLDDARHRAFLSLNEQGVEAGAITTISFSRSFPSFSALRPFHHAVVE
ncbi:hypothetical protein CgunFtcFv8_022235 [Champsocephalus gunnari]|uniref:Ig-like domain-containing protein n=1 Tax=Champsocephalus gunnari TaxID=52237 RepID=A0AAN8DWD3_CHAGU|nr:hypothetical protein CgunFtcFv8_022235 [Champsocephalus gunnari]